MECPRCKTPNRDQARFCKHCGEKLVLQNPASDGSRDFLGNLVGLESIHQELSDMVHVIKRMGASGRHVRMNYHMILTGNSGTAKSLIGDLFFDVLKDLGYLSQSAPVSLDSTEFMNLSREEVQKRVQSARGGMLIIDNAQDLIIRGEEIPSLKHLMLEMEDCNNDPIILLTGLPYGLKGFLEDPENSHFTGRFGKIYHIEDYLPETLLRIIEQQLVGTYGIPPISPEARERLLKRCNYLSREMHDPESELSARNGYLALKEADAIVRKFFLRPTGPRELLPEDIPQPIFEHKSIETILSELDSLVGMDSIKRDIRKIFNQRKIYPDSIPIMHAVLTGNPGTGKTTIARKLGEIYAALGVLPLGHVVEARETDLVAGYVGQTSPKTEKLVDSALGGVLFVDEAYSLVEGNTSFGKKALTSLMARVENDRDKFCCILAGYPRDMKKFFSANSGMESRFPKHFHLEDYTEAELFQIFEIMASREGFQLTEDAETKVRDHIREKVLRKTQNFGNGRIPREILALAKTNLSDRLSEQDKASPEDRQLLTEKDIPSTRDANDHSIHQAMDKLNGLTGLKSVKNKIQELRDVLEINRDRGAVELLSEHFLFTGNPGTGKTTVARIFADLLCSLELIPGNDLIAAKRQDLVGRVDELVDQALGGILFIDEAYQLYGGPSDQTGLNTITALLQRMEDDQGKFICIAAGYSKEMHQFLQSNSGLESRFTTEIHFEDFNAEEMTQIFVSMAKTDGFIVDEDGMRSARQIFSDLFARKTRNFGNAREVRNELKKIKTRHARNLITLKRDPAQKEEWQRRLNLLNAEDITPQGSSSQVRETALGKLHRQVGLQMVKDKVEQILHRLEVQKIQGRQRPLEMHFLFLGNPGTGKTTVARLMADIFHSIGVLPTNKLIEVTKKDLTSGFVSQTDKKTNEIIDRAMGGVLFIDEAYYLADVSLNSFAGDVINTLVDRMEQDRGKFILIAAGYPKEMEDFLATNSGLKSRFTDRLIFEDYSAEQLAAIFKLFAEKDGYSLEEGLVEKVRELFEPLCSYKTRDFGNARTIRQFFDKTLGNQSERLYAFQKNHPKAVDLEQTVHNLLIEDLYSNPGELV